MRNWGVRAPLQMQNHSHYLLFNKLSKSFTSPSNKYHGNGGKIWKGLDVNELDDYINQRVEAIIHAYEQKATLSKRMSCILALI